MVRRLGRSLSTRFWGPTHSTEPTEVPMRSLDRRPRPEAAQGQARTGQASQTTQTSMVAPRTTSRGCGGSVHWGPMDLDDPTDLFGPPAGPSSTLEMPRPSPQPRPVPQPRKKAAAPPVPTVEPTYSVPRAPPLPVHTNRKEKDSGSSEDSSPEGLGRRVSR